MTIDYAKWEVQVQQEVSYHGFLPREDLPHVLERHGDYILRTTEVINEKGKEEEKKKTKELVLAVLVDPENRCNGPIEPEAKDALIRNVIISRVSNRFAIEAGYHFDSIGQLIRFYSTKPVRLNHVSIQLARAVTLRNWEFYHKDVSVGKVLGSGAFGEVHKGTLRKKNGKMVTVAIKSLKTSSAAVSKEQINEMMREARLMRNLNHSNVVRIFGVALCEQPMYILLEFVKGGSLDAYLKKHADILDRDEKLQMVMGAVWGLEYLHRSAVLHRDIASRNCLYDEDKNVKISDFGLSRNGTIYRMKVAKKMPIKWMAPESISSFVFSQKTDVYSMGVLIYEIFACRESYEGLSNTQSRQRINEDKWNEFPDSTPKKLREYVKEKMWEKDPAKRANMFHIRQWMEIYTGLSKVEEAEQMDKLDPTSDLEAPGGARKKKTSRVQASTSSSTTNHSGAAVPYIGQREEKQEKSMIGPPGGNDGHSAAAAQEQEQEREQK